MSTARVEIRSVWDRIPSPSCDGRCADHCRAIGMYEGELELVRERIPSFPNMVQMLEDALDDADYRCPALVLGRCAVYSVRPTVCRIFGSAETLRCPYGCEPDGGLLTKQEASDIMDAAREVAGEPA